MANKQGMNNNSPLSLAEILQQISLVVEQHRQGSVQNSNVSTSSLTNSHDNRQTHESSKRTRRKPRWKKTKDKKNDEESPSRSSLSSSSGQSIPSVKTKVFVPSTKRTKNNIKHAETSVPSTSQVKHLNSQTSLKDFLKMTIKAINTDKYGEFIRKRNPKKKFINISTLSRKSYLMESKYKGSSLKSRYQKDKATARKYPKEESSRIKKQEEQGIEENYFSEYINEKDVQEGLLNGTLVKGLIRINPKNFRESYVNNEDSSIADYCIPSVTDRNRALEGDEVVLQMKSEEHEKTATVVHLMQKVHTRISVGILKLSDKDKNLGLFVPRDKRFPVLTIPSIYWPSGFKDNSKQFTDILFVAKLLHWHRPDFAEGILLEEIGPSGNLKVELTSILKENNLDTTPFTDEIIQSLPCLKSISESEVIYREDLRKMCIFTIDPETAKDLDDAVSVEILPNGNFKVGVHISDVSFYLQEGSELDQIVSKKATTIYLVDSAYHMLPEELCFACSLLPGEDKLAFSIFWEMKKTGEILSTRFSRSIINSCVKLSYEHAQMVIENPNKEFTINDFPKIHNCFEPKDLTKSIAILNELAVILKENRIRNGALKIDKIKLFFSWDPVAGEPLEYFTYKYQEANSLIEEFMLLANISVAQKIYESFPNKAFLRRHEPPKEIMLSSLRSRLSLYGIHLNTSSSEDIAVSLKKYVTDDYAGQCRGVVLNHLTSKAMTRAQYFCSGLKLKHPELNFKHYALSVPIYTHFTSPIRRYADVMVHRLLASAMGYKDEPEWDSTYIEAIAKNCNLQKYRAKIAGEASVELYLAHYIEQHKPYHQDCVVFDVKEKSIDVIVLKTGSIVRLYQNNSPKTIWKYKSNKLTITFPKTRKFNKSTISIELFSSITVSLKRKGSYHLEGSIVRPTTSNRRD